MEMTSGNKLSRYKLYVYNTRILALHDAFPHFPLCDFHFLLSCIANFLRDTLAVYMQTKTRGCKSTVDQFYKLLNKGPFF